MIKHWIARLQVLRRQWPWARVLRLVLGLFFLGDALVNENWALGLLAIFLLYLAFFNWSCGLTVCAAQPQKSPPQSQKPR